MELDANKSITHIAYNHLNLPERVTFNNGKSVKYQYDAAGIKLRKETKEGNNITITDYVSGKHYVNDTLSFFPHREGRVVNNAGTFNYEYNLTDHLGNVRVSLGAGGNVVQRDDYYPFGLTFQSWQKDPPKNLYGFQGQEYQEELGWHQYKWRNADPALGRFFNVDPLAESFYYNSVYAFSENKVISGLELEGLEMIDFRFVTDGAYDGNFLQNSWTFLNNVSGQIMNAPIDMVDGVVSGGYNIFTQPLNQTISATGDEFVQAGKGIKKTTVDTWNYHTNTPLSQQWSDTWTWESWEKPTAFGAELFSGGWLSKAGNVGKLSKLDNISPPRKYESPSTKSFKNGDKFDLDASLFENISNLNGRADLGWLTGSTANFEISAILRSRSSPKNGGFSSLISKLESIAKGAGMTDVRIDFQMVVNNRLKYDSSWAQEYGYFYSTYKDELGGINVVWEKEISN